MRRCAEEQKSGDGQSRAVEKGLRSISKRAFAYMRSLKISTYNEIAEKLIMEMFHHPDQ